MNREKNFVTIDRDILDILLTDSNIEDFIHSLSEDIETISISKSENLTYLPDLTRFKKLKRLHCNENNFKYLPYLPDNIELLDCELNQLICLPNLPKKLKFLYCTNNNLTSLPTLPDTIEILDCKFNQLTYLPELPENLKNLDCGNNNLTSLPDLPANLNNLICRCNKIKYLPNLPEKIYYIYLFVFAINPIADIIKNDTIFIDRLGERDIKNRIRIINRFRQNYFLKKYKDKFREWLWIKVRQSKIEAKYHPNYLFNNLSDENDDLDNVLNNWSSSIDTY